MDKTLYPLKFVPIYKSYIWGGNKLHARLNKKNTPEIAAESWEISGVENNVSIVANGFLKGNALDELIEVYMGDLVGDSIYEKYGTEFPVLLKYLDANDDLSIQVHPDDEFAMAHNEGKGKTEMWYIIESEEDSELISGFKEDISEKNFQERLSNKSLTEILNFEKVRKGDVFFLPAGRVHAINKGILLAEIQQTSDATYRIYDYDRVGTDGKTRELHIDQALKVMDFKKRDDIRTRYIQGLNQTINLVDCPYFTTNLIEFDQAVDKDFALIDSFVAYMCTEGKMLINFKGGKPLSLEKGESILIPAELKEISLIPSEKSTLLEVYMKS